MYRFSFGLRRLGRSILPFVAIAATFSAAAPLRAAEKVPFAKLLPADVLAYLHVTNAAEVRDLWWNTSTGRMAQDPQFKPTLDQTFAAAEKAFTPAYEKFGLTLAEWLTLPKGEIGFAVVGVDGGDPAFLLIMEAADDDRSIAVLLEKGRQAALADGTIEESERVGDVELTIFRASAGKAKEVLYLRRDGKLVISTSRDAVKKALQLWNGDGTDTLAEHPTFVNLQRFVGKAENKPAEILWYVDPINLARQVLQGNTGAQIGLALLPALGLDGLTAVGGSAAFNRGAFDVIGQAYILLNVPRSGVVELIALRPTPTEPEPWVFDKLTSYGTFSWDVERTYHQLRHLTDAFQGDGAFHRQFRDPLKKETDLDLEEELISKVTGRVSFIVANDEPIEVESRGFLLGFEFGDEKQAEKLVRYMAERYHERWTAATASGHTYYRWVKPEEPPPNADGNRPRPRRTNQTSFCALGKYVLMADRPSLIERALAADGDAAQRLAGSLDFKLIVSKAKRYAGLNGPGYLGFTRPAEELRYVHGLAQNARIHEQLAKGGEKNPFWQDLQQALTDRPLPPFEVIERYFAPGGTVIVDEPTGIRYFSFVLKRGDAN